MRSFLTALLTVFVIAGCGSSTGDDGTTEYPFNEQTWKVNSGEQADWMGSSSTAKGKVFSIASDSSATTIINKPNKYGLEIVEGYKDSLYEIRFIDSTITQSNLDSLDIGPARADTLFGFARNGGGREWPGDHPRLYNEYPFECDGDYTEEDSLSIHYLSGSNREDTVRTYTLPIQGALETVDHIVCES